MTAKGKKKGKHTVLKCTALRDNRGLDDSKGQNKPGMSNATCSAADPGSGTFLTPGSGTGKNPDLGSGINFPDQYFRELINKLFGSIYLKFL